MKKTLKSCLKEAYTKAEDSRAEASDKDEFSAMAEYSRLCTVLYDLSCYFGEEGTTRSQKERLTQMGFKMEDRDEAVWDYEQNMPDIDTEEEILTRENLQLDQAMEGAFFLHKKAQE